LKDLKKIEKGWTLFIDRDGVVNEEKINEYVHHWHEFKFYDKAKEAFKILSEIFTTIIMVTNQRGVARGLTKLEDLKKIHTNMELELRQAGGRIDKIYYCTDMESPNRKPNPGMGLKALKDFPKIELTKSVMIGNALSDMEFGRNLGVAVNIFLSTTIKDVVFPDERIDYHFNSLYEAAQALAQR